MIYYRKCSHNERSDMRDEEFLEDYLRQVRAYQPGLPPPFLREMVAYEEQVFLHTSQRGDQHAPFRLSVLYELHKAFSLEDRTFIRFLLEQEIIYAYRIWAFPHSIHFCGFLLFMMAEVEDIQLLWKAKTTSFDTWCGFDVQLLVGAGVPATLAYLRRVHEPWSQKAEELIEKCQQGKNFDDLDGYRTKWNAEFHRRASIKRTSFL